MNKVDVVMLSPDLDVKGGISFVVLEYLKGGLADQVNLRFIPTHKDGGHFKKIGVFIMAVGRFIALAPKMKNMIVHFHTSQNGSFFRKFTLFCLAKLLGAKTVVHIHGSQFETFMTRNALFRSLTQFYFDRADRILVMSNQWLKRLSGFTKNRRITLIFNPISLAKVSDSTRSEGLNVLFMGRLGRRKVIYDLLQCVDQNKTYFRDKSARFILAGDGEVDRVRQYVADHDLQDLIEVPGWIASEQKERYLKAANILILPSYNEQMPMSILEAMSHGCPVVATRIAGIPDMIEHGVNGFLFEPGDIGAMTHALKDLCADATLREKMGRCGHERVKEKFENTKIVSQLVSIYEDLD
jgi:glycosyltransferase involved in cell wall biosynthesis